MPKRSTLSITDQFVRRTNYNGKQSAYFDKDTVGFGLFVSATKKTFIVQARIKGDGPSAGLERRVSLGQAGVGALTAADARKQAAAFVQRMREGHDPKRKDPVVIAPTLRLALDGYIARAELRPASVHMYTRMINKYAHEWLDLKLADITRRMVFDKHNALRASVGKADGGKVTANVVIRIFRMLYNDARDRDPTLPENPCAIRKKWFRETPRDRIVKRAELPAFLVGVTKLPNHVARDLILFMLFTGSRRHESSVAKWSWFDESERTITIPDDVTKGKRKHVIYLSDYLFNMLVTRRAAQRKSAPDDWIFPGRRGPFLNPNPYLALFGVSCHDLRRTYVTIANSLNLSPYTIKGLVNHASGNDVTSDYSQPGQWGDVRVAAQRVSDEILRLARFPRRDPSAELAAAEAALF